MTAKMKTEPKRRRLTRTQRHWLKFQEFIPLSIQRSVCEVLPFLVHARRLGLRVECIPSDNTFDIIYDDPEPDVNTEAKAKAVLSVLQTGYAIDCDGQP